ncbi:hypothetical protein G5714_016565 [Onychostoma macrolepis]|uniref:Uncharacterized protein n=2 Tax=Onychostoma macrolepis TaxID=369639 RepID=A0A7J6CCY9_9TELE|nr:hypothetical protein G5714_016565 [Onychostoma macrolepis]
MLIPEIREHVSLTDDCRVSQCHDQELSPSIIMDLPPPMSRLDVDVDLGFALFFLVLLCLFLLVTMVRCAQMVLDPYSAISVSTYQEEQVEG